MFTNKNKRTDHSLMSAKMIKEWQLPTLKKLKKDQLIHLLESGCGNETDFMKTREFQKSKGIKCWDCEIIEDKLK